MKKLILLSTLVIFIALSGCIRYNEKMKLNSDGSGELTFAIGISEEILNMGGGQNGFDEFDENKIKEDYTKKDGVKYVSGKTFSKDGNKWIEVTLQFDSVEKLAAASQDSSKKGMIGVISLKEENGNWVFTRSISEDKDTGQTDSADAANQNMMNMMFAQYNWEYELTLPSKIISTNAVAENVNHSTNTVKWVFSMANLSSAQTMTVVFEKQAAASSNLLIIVIVVVVILIILAFVFLRKKKPTVEQQMQPPVNPE
ncbi:MAG: hypothetical protein V1720_14505 [bacterium]